LSWLNPTVYNVDEVGSLIRWNAFINDSQQYDFRTAIFQDETVRYLERERSEAQRFSSDLLNGRIDEVPRT